METDKMEIVDEGGVPAGGAAVGGDESDADELTIDDSCIVNECGEEEDDNVELVSSTMNVDEEATDPVVMQSSSPPQLPVVEDKEVENDPESINDSVKNDDEPMTVKNECPTEVPPPPEKNDENPPPESPQGPESPSIQSPDPSSQPPTSPPLMAASPPKSPEQSSTPFDSQEDKKISLQTEAIVSQENFSSLNTSAITLSTITSQSSVTPTPSQTDNEESQSSQPPASPTPPPKSNGSRSSRSKSRSRSNTVEEEEDDVDLEDGEIMDDEEEEAPPSKSTPAASSSKKDKEKEKKSSSSSVSSKEKEKERREKEKEKEREKDKHRKDKKRSKREEEKEKDKKNKKRKASDAESEQDEYMLVRGGSPGGGVGQEKSQSSQSNPWAAPVEEFGDDSKVSKAKRRRESDEDSGSHHHHSSRPTREPSPPRRPPPQIAEPPSRGKPSRPMRDDRKESKSDVICAYFMQGKCQKSAMECSFSHDAVPPRKMELCKFWMMECCAKKEKCIYLHNDFPCKYFHTGLICKAADRCKFSHKPLSDVTKQVLLKHIETAPKEILGDFPRLNRQGAINLINKMEARMRGEAVDDDRDGYGEMNHNDHHGGRGPPIPPLYERHHGRNDDRHRRDHHGGHHHHPHGPPPLDHMRGPPHGRNDMRGPPPGGPGRDDRHMPNNRSGGGGGVSGGPSRWEQHPTRDDQEKLQELMEEAGISGFYKETMESNNPQPPPGLPPLNQPPPGNFPPPGLNPGLLPLNPLLMSQMMPGLIPNTTANSVPNPAAFANVLASLSNIAPPTTLAGLPLNVPPPSIVSSHSNDDSNDATSSSAKPIPDHLPKMQQELFMRVQKSQQKVAEKKKESKSPPQAEPEENWYSSEDEDEPKKNNKKAEDAVADKISSMLSQIRQQQQQTAASQPKIPPLSSVDTNKPFYGDTDFRSQPPPPQSSSFKDVDLRNPASIFKKIDIEPAREINASLAHNGPFPWRVRKVRKPKIDYSTARIGLPPSIVLLDPRLTSKRGGNGSSIPAPASPTETTAPDIGIQPLTIPDSTPVFDPRMRGAGGGGGLGGRGSGLTPQQNNPFLDSDNSLPNSGVNEFASMFNRDPRGAGASGPPGGGSSGQAAAQQMAMAAALAAMQSGHGLPPAGIDPSMLLMGFPFMPPQNNTGGGGGGSSGGPPMDFQQMLAAGGGMRMRPPFPPPSHHHHHQSGGNSWEKYSQGGGGGGDLTPPL